MSCMTNQRNDESEKGWNIKTAQWHIFANRSVWLVISEYADLLQSAEFLEDLYHKLNVSDTEKTNWQVLSEAVVVIRTKEVKAEKRTTLSELPAEQIHSNFTKMKKKKKSRAEHKLLVQESKKKDWRDFVSKIRKDTKIVTIYE